MIAKKKVYIIINPASGTSDKKGFAHKVAKKLDPKKFETHIFITGYAGHGTEIAKAAVRDKVDYVVAVGGDGTVNEIGKILVNTDITLGIIPLGSGNGLGRDLNISTNVNKALDVIAEENIIEIDYGLVNGQVFLCTCGVGFDAVVANKAVGQKRRGTLMYFKNMLNVFFKQEPANYEIQIPEGRIEQKAFVVTCANASQYGYNAHIAPHADIQDGKMNITILTPLRFIDVPKIGIQLFTRTLDESNKMIELVTQKATIKRTTEGVMHIDGDPVQAGKEINVEIISKGLKVLVPSKPPKRSPLDPIELLSIVFGNKK